LVTPINGNNQNQIGSFDNIVVAGPYPLIRWANGLSATNSIPGDKALQIDEADGTVKVKPDKTGLYLFTINCTEFRNGIQIGLTRLDFQFPVVDCSLNTPPTPLVRYKGAEIPEIEHCEATDAILETDNDPSWVFQWQKDGVEIPGATANSISTNEEGTYKVIKSLNSVCTDEIASEEVKLTLCERDLKIYIPTAFSPNGDGMNDELRVFGKSVDTFSFAIFNRWGEIIFESNNINNLWNGGLKNDGSNPVPAGQYSYVIQVFFTNGEKFEKRDTVMLLR
jgi:gliding motility-associated-like protein